MAKGFSIAGSIDIDSSKANKALDNFSKGMSDFSNSFAGKVGKACEKVGGSLQSFGTKLTGLGTAVGGVTVKMASDFENTMAKVSTLTSDGMYQSLHDGILDMSGRLGVDANEIGEAIYQGLSSGVSEQNIQDFTEKMIKLSKGGFTSVSTATDLTTTALNAYGLEITETDHLMDVFINTQNRGKTTVDQLASSMGQVIPIASSLGVNIDQLGASYAILTANGISTSESGTKLKAMFEELGDSGSDVSEILIEQTGKSFKELTAEGKSTGDVLDILKQYADNAGIGLNELFGSSEAGSAALILAKDGAAGFNEELKGMAESSGAAADAYAKVSDTFSEKCNKLKERFKEVGIAIGENLIDIIEQKVLPAIEDFADWLGNLDEDQINNIATMVEWAVKIGAVVTAFGVLTKGVSGVISILGTANSVISTLSGLFGGGASAAGTMAGALGGVSSAAAAGTSGLGALGSFAASLPALFNPVTLAVAAAVATIGGIGFAFYKNQKACEEGEKQFEKISIAADDFTGRLKTNKSIWTKIFGEKLELHFSDSYKEETRQIEEDFENFKKNLGKTSDEINDIMRNTNLTPSQKDQQIDEVYNGCIAKTDEKIKELTEVINNNSQKIKLKKYITEELRFPESTADETIKQYDNFFNTRKEDAENAQNEIKQIYQKAADENRNLNKEELDKIAKLEKEYSEARADLIATNSEDILNKIKQYNAKETKIEEEHKDNLAKNDDERVKDILKANEKKKKAREDYLKSFKDKTSEEYKAAADEYQKMCENDERYAKLYEANLNSRATYDKKWAEEHGISVSKIQDENGNLIGSIQKAGEQTVGVFLDNSTAARKWAEENNYATEEIIDQHGNLVLAVKDTHGNIVGSIVDLESIYRNNYHSIKETIKDYVTGMGGSVTDVNKSLELIKQGLANGEIDYQQYGAISEEAFLKMAEAAMRNRETISSNVDAIQQKYEQHRGQIHDLISSSEEYTKTVQDENGNLVVSYDETMAAVGRAVDEGKIKIEDYGATNKEEFMAMASAAIQNKEVISGSLDGLQSAYERYGETIRQTVENQKAYNEDGSVNVEQTMQNISSAIENGGIYLQNFGNMSKEEFELLCRSALEGKDKLDGVENALSGIDGKDWKAKIDSEDIEKTEKKTEDLWSKASRFLKEKFPLTFESDSVKLTKEQLDSLEAKTVEVDGKTISIKANEESIKDAKATLKDINETQKIIDQQIVELQTDQSQLEQGSEGYNEIQRKIDELNGKKATLNTDKTELEEAINFQETVMKYVQLINEGKITLNTDGTQITNVQQLQEEVIKRCEKINGTVITPKSDKFNIDKLKEAEDEAQEKASVLTGYTIKPNSDTGNVENVTKAENQAQQGADNLTKTNINPRSSIYNIENITAAENQAQQGANNLTNTTVNPKSSTVNVENVTTKAGEAKIQLDKVGSFVGNPLVTTWGMSEALSTAGSIWDTLWSIVESPWNAVVNITKRIFGNEAGTEYQNAYARGTESVSRIKKYATGAEKMYDYQDNFVPFIAGEQGPELVSAPVGSKVYTHRATRSGNVGSNIDLLQDSNQPIIKIYLDGKELAKSTAKYISNDMNKLSNYRNKL